MNRLILFILCHMPCSCAANFAASPSIPPSAIITANTRRKNFIFILIRTLICQVKPVWMKAYLLSDQRPSYVSKNLYFDWTDADGRLLSHSVSPIAEGGASSFFKIPAWVKNGVIHVKAYTQWMLNFDNAFLFNKDIPVLMPVEGSYPVAAKIQTTISFFPEGGDLINGVSSVLAFEALNQHNKPAAVSGVIKNLQIISL